MGTAYTSTDYATIPNPVTIEFITDWVPGILQYRMDECDTSDWHTVYIKYGSAETPGESPDIHYAQTAAEIQTIIDDHDLLYTDGIVFAIEAGTTWSNYSESAITIDRANACLTRFGDGVNPLFHGTATLAELGVASLGSPSGGVYSVTLGEDEMTGKTFTHMLDHWGSTPRSILTATPYVWKATAVAVAAAGDFHYDSGTRVLTFYPLATATLTTSGFRCVVHTASTFSGSMLKMNNHDRIIVRDIDVIGTDGNEAASGGQVWAIISLAKSTNAHLISGCMGVLNSDHNVGQYNTTSGGIVTVAGCDVGLCKHYGSIPIVFYAASGGQESYTESNRVYRWVTNEVISTFIERNTQPIYAHTSGGANDATLTLFHGDYVWAGQWGYSAKPLNGDPPNAANFDDDLITDARVFVVDCVMDGGDYAARKLTSNLARVLGAFAGHVYVNCHYHSYYWNRTTDTSTIEYFELSTSDYDYRGWEINPIWEIDVGAVSGNFNFGLLRNNLSTGTEPDRAGVLESQVWNGTLYFSTPAGLNITGTWNCLSGQQNGAIATATGNLNNGPMRLSFINSLIVNNSAANSSEDLVLGIPEGDPTGSRYADAALSEARGGCRKTMFKGCKDQEADQGGFRNFGTEWFKANTACADFVGAYTDPRGIPDPSAEWVLSSATALHSSADGAILEYDHYGRPRPGAASARAIGAVEAGTQADGSQTGPSMAIGMGMGL
jgi:hypothetical protein